MIVTLQELIDLVIMIAAVGFIFSSIFRMRVVSAEGVPVIQKFSMESFKMAVYITAPAIVLHEFAHKFVAIAFGYDAIFHAAYLFLAIGIMLRLLKFPFIFFVPGFVEVLTPEGLVSLQTLDPAAAASIAIAGPAMNLLLWLIPKFVLKSEFKMKNKTRMLLSMTSKINMFLFFLNMIPFGFFDGAHFFRALLSMF